MDENRTEGIDERLKRLEDGIHAVLLAERLRMRDAPKAEPSRGGDRLRLRHRCEVLERQNKELLERIDQLRASPVSAGLTTQERDALVGTAGFLGDLGPMMSTPILRERVRVVADTIHGILVRDAKRAMNCAGPMWLTPQERTTIEKCRNDFIQQEIDLLEKYDPGHRWKATWEQEKADLDAVLSRAANPPAPPAAIRVVLPPCPEFAGPRADTCEYAWKKCIEAVKSALLVAGQKWVDGPAVAAPSSAGES